MTIMEGKDDDENSNDGAPAPPSPPFVPPTTASDRSFSGETFVEESADVLQELYYHVLKYRDDDHEKREDSGNEKAAAVLEGDAGDERPLMVKDVVASLLVEGIFYWRDQRFQESQNVALRLSEQPCRSTAQHQTRRLTADAINIAEAVTVSYADFVALVSPCAFLFLKLWSEEAVIPDWSSFTTDMAYHFYEVEQHKAGSNAQYIPILRDADPDRFGLSICSIDGQRFSIGDALVPHSLQSVSKPVTYALGLARDGPDFVDEWIGVEPSGRPFNSQDLEPGTNRPFNASVNSGAIMAAGVYTSAFPSDTPWRDVVDKVREKWFHLCGRDLDINFSQETYESEKETAYNNFAIAYNLKGRRGLPRDVDLHKMLDVYLGCCSIEIQTEALAVAAATFANGGVCPITGREVFPAHVTRSVLSELMVAGMYDGAGLFAVEVGLPAKSGVSGCLMVIVPNVFGFATFSPRLNAKGNSVRGIEFCKRLVGSYRVHVFEPLRSGNTGAKLNPCHNGWKQERLQIARFTWAVEVGDVYAKRLRDIFLFALCRTAISLKEGLSGRMQVAVREQYELLFQVPVDEALFGDVVAAVKQNPDDMRYLERLTHDTYVVDTMRSLIFTAMEEIMSSSYHQSSASGVEEKKVAVEIARLLGIDNAVAKMEFNRYEQQGPHHSPRESCELIDVLDFAQLPDLRSSMQPAGVGDSPRRQPPEFSPRQQHRDRVARIRQQNAIAAPVTKGDGACTGADGNNRRLANRGGGAPDSADRQEELLYLRREVLRLRRKVDKLSTMLQQRAVNVDD